MYTAVLRFVCSYKFLEISLFRKKSNQGQYRYQYYGPGKDSGRVGNRPVIPEGPRSYFAVRWNPVQFIFISHRDKFVALAPLLLAENLANLG
jgi:hypothetical protein